MSPAAQRTARSEECGASDPKGKASLDPKTVGLLITATEYAVAAVHRMVQQSANHPEALQSVLQQYVDLVFGLEVSFVFPNLASGERELLVSLMKVRNALGVQMSGLPQWRTAAQRTDHEQLTAELKSEFAALCGEVREANLEGRLDSVQQSILDEEFLSVVLNKEKGTKLFYCSRPTPPTVHPTDSPPPEPSKVEQPECTSTARKKVLIIDRSRSEAGRIAGWLTQSGYEAIVGVPGFESCRQAMREKPDLILLEFTGANCDWPTDTVLDGQTTFKVLARIPKAQGTPVLGMASQDKPAIRDEALQAGAMACLCKPLDQERLLKAVRVILDDLAPLPEDKPSSRPELASSYGRY